jgi:Tol biopolymer transport system component
MLELREVFEMVTKQTEPDLDSWKQQEDRQRRRARNQKLVAIAVAAAAVVAAGVFVLATRPATQEPVDQPTPLPFVTTPPIGPQIVGLDGAPLAQLPPALSDASSIRLSPDGSTLAYMADGVLHTVGIDGTNDRTLTDDANTNDGDAQNHVDWSPDGTQLAYAYSGDIYVINADGSDQHAVTHVSDQFHHYYPVWSPDGTTIAYWSGSATGEDGGPADAEIDTVVVENRLVTQLTHNGISDIEPAWSPDGSKIAYWHGGALWIIRADGNKQHEVLAGDRGGAWAPAWAPNGRSIAFIAYDGNLSSGQGGAPLMQLRTIELKTGTVSNLHMHALTDWNGPQWVSNGEILFNRYN